RRLERLVREILGARLESLERLDHAGDAADRLFERPCDLLLLDLTLGADDGFEILRRAVSRPFATVVVSAHGERALEAFELGVLDFVPKPFSRRRLEQALRRATGELAAARKPSYLAVRRSGAVHLLPIHEVVFVRASGDYAELHAADGGVHLHDKTLTRLEALLPERFLRIHRSYLVDLERARRLKAEEGSRYRLELRCGRELPVGRTRVAELKKLLV
ncbi:MAG: LytTR family DNA-binding domain-containing protein, partial [Acidobacteriota bacterium]